MSAEERARPVAVIGAGLDLGAGRRGVDMGPSAIRHAGLHERIASLGRDWVDWGDVTVDVPEATEIGDPQARYLESIKRVVRAGRRACRAGARGGIRAARARRRPFDCDRHARRHGGAHGPGGVLWVDAHGDLNRPSTSPSGNVHGMPLAAALGVAGPEFESSAWPTPSVERAALVGVRSLDAGERALIDEIDARVFTMSDVDRLGLERVLREALAFLAGTAFLHVSFDLDVVDPMFAPGVGTPVRGGLSYREAHLILELVAEAGSLDSLELVEVNPILDRENETGILAVELAASALGARIL